MNNTKFRAWHKDLKRLVYFTIEDLIYNTVFNADRTAHWVLLDASLLENEARYSGIEDKNGVDIFEGDIVRSTVQEGLNGPVAHPVFVVLWESSYCRFVIQPRGEYDSWHGLGQSSKYSKGSNSYLEVIGNIYENPEMME